MLLKSRYEGFGGQFAPQVLIPALEELEKGFILAQACPEFQKELKTLLRDFAGRPTPLYECRRLLKESPIRLFLKREDLVHGGAHKTNQVLAQGLLAKRLGKKRIISETGAGQQGVALALVGALLGLETVVYMGAKDIARQQPNVKRMKLLGAQVVSVKSGNQTLKAAVNEALRDWAGSFETTHFCIGTVVGPHPFPRIVRDFQKIIGEETRKQILEQTGHLPDKVVACIGAGSNAMGIFHPFKEDHQVELIGVEAYGKGLDTPHHGASLNQGKMGILHGALTTLLQNDEGQVSNSHSIAAGLDYPCVGPEVSALKKTQRAHFTGCTDQQALKAFHLLSQKEGIIPALESSHALGYVIEYAKTAEKPEIIVVNLSGRGDKDLNQIYAKEFSND